jgi:nondiscriminating aspartyl-tRNA synthetase
MEKEKIKDLESYIDKEVYIGGWVDVRRDHGKLIFIDIRDGEGYIQAVVLPEHKETLEIASTLRSEDVVYVKGKVNKRPDKMIKVDQQNGSIELEVLEIKVLSKASELPFDHDADLNIDTLLDYRPLTLRRKRNRAIFKVQSEILRGFREALIAEDFVEFQAPKIIGGDAEGGSNIFKVEYFKGQDAYLATSPQLYKQIMVGIYERVFTTGNVFRAEKHATTRHINEYTSLDFEFGFIKDHQDVMEMEKKVITHIIKHLNETCLKEFELLDAKIPEIPKEFPQMKLKEAQKLISEATGEDCTNEPDLDPSHEKWLCEYAEKEFGSEFIFITHYPTSKRPMYTYEDENDLGYTKSFDLLFRGMEITTGGQRIHDHDLLKQKIEERGLDSKNFSFYLQAFKYGMPPHGGLGIGLERLTAKFLNIQNIKEATVFPRDINRIDSLLTKEKKEDE